jgi:hypothetical protein
MYLELGDKRVASIISRILTYRDMFLLEEAQAAWTYLGYLEDR